MLEVEGGAGQQPKGVDDLCFHTYGELSPYPQIPAKRPKPHPRGWDLGLRLRFGPQGWDLGLQARIWASRLGFWPGAWDSGLDSDMSPGRPDLRHHIADMRSERDI